MTRKTNLLYQRKVWSPRRILWLVAQIFLGAFFILLAIFPLAWMVIAGFKSKTEVISTPFQLFPEVWHWSNYVQIMQDETFLRAMAWTFLGATLFTVGSLAVNSMAAYAFARLEFPFKRALWVIVITTMFILGTTILLTSFIVVTKLYMFDTLAVFGAAWPGLGGFCLLHPTVLFEYPKFS